ncbi:tyrosine-protein kinase family protein [Actinokineospora soli]|uniref:Tyrosine-protein kinase family protein n=1 Tax=Actinokineospora soli TaxID=1048753 RepID=A0ABW2TLI8_9PSEU
MIVTFYSYKGGVGRSFCLANIAVQLANWGNRVLCVDWDLEAPGLHEYFRQWLPEPPQRGVVELVIDDGPLDWRSAVLPVRIPNVDRLDLLAAGRMDSGYVDRVQAISWPKLYAENDLGWRFEQFAEDLRAEYDFVLIDSRTGITDIGGICTAQLPDVLVLCLTPNRQSLDGATDVARRAAAARNHLPYDKSALLVLPVVSRFDGREEYQRAQHWRREITGYCEPFYTSWVPKQVPATQVVERTTVPYLPYWSFGEELPAITENSANPEMVTHYLDNIAALIAHRLADAHILGANRDAYVTSARARSNRTDQLADIGVYGGPAEHAREVRAALTALGLQVLPPPAPPEGTRAALVLSDRHSRSGPWNDVMEQAASSRIASLNWINNDAPPAEVAARAVRFFGGVLRDLPPRWADALVKAGSGTWPTTRSTTPGTPSPAPSTSLRARQVRAGSARGSRSTKATTRPSSVRSRVRLTWTARS